MGIAFIPLYIQYLGIESYGLIGVFAVMQAWFTLLDFGMTPTLNREMARFTAGGHTPQSIKDLLRSLEIIAWVIGVCIIAGVWAASFWLASDWLKAEKLPVAAVAQAISIMGLVVALRFVEGLYRGAVIGLQKQIWLNYILSLSATARWAGAALVVVFIRPDIEAFFLWQGAVSIITIIIFATRVHGWLPKTESQPRFSISSVSEIWRFASGMLLTTLLALILTQVDKVLLSKLISLKEFGYYTLASTMVGVLYQAIIPFTQAYYPRFTEMVTRKDNIGLINNYHQAAQLVTVFIVSVSLSLMVFSQNILIAWTGDLALSAYTAPILSVLTFGTMLNGLMHIPYMLQLAHGWSSFAVRVNVIAILFLVPAILWATPQYGPIGAAWCWAILNIGYATIGMYFMYRRLLTAEKWRWYSKDIFIPSIAIVSISFISYLIHPNSMSRVIEIMWISMTVMGSIAAGLITSKDISVKAIFNQLIKKIQII